MLNSFLSKMQNENDVFENLIAQAVIILPAIIFTKENNVFLGRLQRS